MSEASRRVLIVDDDEKNLRLMEAILAPFGHEVYTAPNGEEALAKAQQTRPDIILLDVMMPVMDGFEVCRRLKSDKSTSDIPVVMVTALGERDDRIQGLHAGADDFLTKPVDKTELSVRVKNLLKVKAYTDHLKQDKEVLEKQVSERTAQLTEAMDALSESHGQTKHAYLDTIYRLAVAAEYKDEDTAAHLRRMSHYSAAIAKQIGLPDEEVEIILYASPMHDIGKIGIPDAILGKPGQLTPEEWDIMKTHTTIGGKILAGSDSYLLNTAEVIALTHHERYDGTGYPKGLAGEGIPTIGRVIALADAFDAMTSRRPYKPAFSFEKTVEIINRTVGKHFDPRIVAAFFEITDEIHHIKEQFRDLSLGGIYKVDQEPLKS